MYAWKRHIKTSKRTILNIKDRLIDEAANIAGIKEKHPSLSWVWKC